VGELLLAEVRNDGVSAYRAICKLTFELER
jgi:hypothetical protein